MDWITRRMENNVRVDTGENEYIEGGGGRQILATLVVLRLLLVLTMFDQSRSMVVYSKMMWTWLFFL